MNFSYSLELLKSGYAVAREGWNGKGMFLYLVKGSFDGPARGFAPGDQVQPDHGSTQDGISMSLFECGDADTVTRLPCIAMRTASGAIIHGWLASQADLLAEDWIQVLPEGQG